MVGWQVGSGDQGRTICGVVRYQEGGCHFEEIGDQGIEKVDETAKELEIEFKLLGAHSRYETNSPMCDSDEEEEDGPIGENDVAEGDRNDLEDDLGYQGENEDQGGHEDQGDHEDQSDNEDQGG